MVGRCCVPVDSSLQRGHSPLVDALSTINDLINLFQAARMLFPDLGDQPRFFLLGEVTAMFRAVEGNAVDRFGEPNRLFYYRSHSGTEVDFVMPAANGTAANVGGGFAAESKYVDSVTVNDSKAMAANFGGGLLLTRGAIDLEQQVRGVTVLPAALFAWLLHQER